MRLLFSIALAMSIASAGYADPRLKNLLAGGSQSGAGVVALFWSSQESFVFAMGRIEPGGRAARPDDRFLLASVSKPNVPVAMMRLHQQGRLNIDSLATNFLSAEVIDGLGMLDIGFSAEVRVFADDPSIAVVLRGDEAANERAPHRMRDALFRH